ncbi:GNAT family N-acetyltransferase [Pseudomonas sp. A46]|nr:GNAT family N-acetyltransferase [Pseudomonas sp. A46]OWJ96859.1 GNAT family N-acetyltransferase [Pseudomonas sp. A46]
MTANPNNIVIERFGETHLDGITALYNDPAIARQLLQMPFQSREVWRKRLGADDDRLVSLVALHQGSVIGHCSLEQHPRPRRAHCGVIGMAVAVEWQGQGVGSRLLETVLEVADNWMNLHRVELTVYTDNEAALTLYGRFGFESEGVLRDYALRDGRFVDALSMARLRRARSA